MKKLLALLITLILALGMLAACGNDPCEVHTDGNSDGICDVCEEKLPTGGENGGESGGESGGENAGGENAGANQNAPCTHTDVDHNFVCDTCKALLPNNGLNLVNSFMNKVESAGSFKLELTAKVLNTTEGDPEADPFNETTSKLFITAALNKAGGIDMMVETQVLELEDKDGTPVDSGREKSAFIIDGVFYNYSSMYGGYVIREMDSEVNTEQLASIIAMLTEGMDLEIDKAELDAALTLLGEKAIATLDIKNNKGGISVDLKDEANAVIEYVLALTAETTVGEVLNDVFALVDEQLTVEALIALVSDTLDLTVTEALAEIDAALTEQNGTTLQSIYDEIVADPNVVIFLKNYFTLVNAENEEITDIDAAFDEVYAEITAFKLADMITEYGLGEAPLYTVLMEVVMGVPTEECPTKEEFDEMLLMYPSLPITEILTGETTPTLEDVQAMLAGITFDKLSASLEIDFIGAFEPVTFLVSAGISATNVMADGEIVSKASAEFTLLLHSIYPDPIKFALPEDAAVYYDYLYNDYRTSHNDGYASDCTANMYLNEDGDKVNLLFTQTRDGLTVEITASELDMSILAEKTVVIPAELLTVTFNGAPLDFNTEGADLAFIPTTEGSGEMTVVSLPEYVFPIDVEKAIYEFSSYGKSSGYTLSPSSGIISVRYYTDVIEFSLDDSFYIESISVNYVKNADGSITCTVNYFTCDAKHPVKSADLTSGWYGGPGEDEDVSIFLGEDLTFVIRVNENNEFVIEGTIPDVKEEYKAS